MKQAEDLLVDSILSQLTSLDTTVASFPFKEGIVLIDQGNFLVEKGSLLAEGGNFALEGKWEGSASKAGRLLEGFEVVRFAWVGMENRPAEVGLIGEELGMGSCLVLGLTFFHLWFEKKFEILLFFGRGCERNFKCGKNLMLGLCCLKFSSKKN